MMAACVFVVLHISPALFLSSICDVQEIPGKIYVLSVSVFPLADTSALVCPCFAFRESS